MCIDYRKLNVATKKDHFPLSFIDEMLERLAKHSSFYFLNGYLGYHPSPSIPTTKVRPRSHAPTEPTLMVGCHLGYVTLLHHSKDA